MNFRHHNLISVRLHSSSKSWNSGIDHPTQYSRLQHGQVVSPYCRSRTRPVFPWFPGYGIGFIFLRSAWVARRKVGRNRFLCEHAFEERTRVFDTSRGIDQWCGTNILETSKYPESTCQGIKVYIGERQLEGSLCINDHAIMKYLIKLVQKMPSE